jgi:hypothetical protein
VPEKTSTRALLLKLGHYARKLADFVSDGGGADFMPTESLGCASVILSIMRDMVIPSSHRQEIEDQLCKISSECKNKKLSGDINILADQISKEG